MSGPAVRRGLGAKHATRTPAEWQRAHPGTSAAGQPRPFVRGTPKGKEVNALLRRWYGVLAERVLAHCRMTAGEAVQSPALG
jgi:hypothetical protein